MTTAVAGASPRLPPTALLVVISATGPAAMHLFVPSMPGLVVAFSTTPAQVQLTLTVYMLALAVATLAYGPLSDRYGRRPVLLAGLALYGAASLVCALAPSIEWLIAGRALQAVGGCAGLVLGRTIVRDCYERDRAASVIAAITMVMAVVPALSPAIGGYLDVWFGWRAGFVLLALYGFAVLAAALPWLNETNRYLGTAASAIDQISGFVLLLRTRAFLGFGLHCVCTLAAWYALVAGTPYVMVALMGHTPSDYGLWFIVIAAGWIAGNFLTARTAARIGAERLVLVGALVAMAASAVLAVVVAADALTAPRLFAPLAAIGLGHGLSQPSAMACAIGVRPELAGRASGLLGFVQMATGAAAAQLLGAMLDDSAWPLVIMVAAFTLLSFAAWALAVSGRDETRTALG